MKAKTTPVSFVSSILVAERGTFLFAKVPPEISASHLRRGRITARVTVGRHGFDALMEPDGQLGHWFVVPLDVIEAEGLQIRHETTFTLTTLNKQPEPRLPQAFKALLARSPAAQATWNSATTLAKIDWVHWMESAKQASTAQERIVSAIDMLEQGTKRVCCFDPSGFYSKALSCPREEIG